jgi:hypothetical protein
MNGALLKIPSIREGTPFCRVVSIEGVAHLNQLSAPSQSRLTTELSGAKLLPLPSGPAVLICRRQKAALSFLPNPAPRTQVP